MKQFLKILGKAIDFPFKTIAVLLIQIYRYTLSAFAGRNCRHLPSCSEYTKDAIWKFGFWKGGWVGLARVIRCRPKGTDGFDPIPKELPKNAYWYRPWTYGRWK